MGDQVGGSEMLNMDSEARAGTAAVERGASGRCLVYLSDSSKEGKDSVVSVSGKMLLGMMLSAKQ